MRLEQGDASFIFSTIELPDIFFTEYLSQSSGDQIKVYLYILFLSKYGKEIRLNDLSKKLNLPLKVIQDAIKYLEDTGLITKRNTGYIVNNLQEIELHKLYHPKTALSPEQILENSKNKYRANAIETISNTFFSGVMSSSWYSDIDLWFQKYNFDEEVMIALFQYCFDHSALHHNYIETVASAWAKNQIKTFSDLEKYYEKQEKINTIAKTISKKLGFSRQLSQYEQAYVEKWLVDYGYSFDIIEIALKKTTSKANPNFDYIDRILSDWYDHKLKTADEIQKYLADMKQKSKDVANMKKNTATNFNNYEQRLYENLDRFYANKK